jgi:hypothetical protein
MHRAINLSIIVLSVVMLGVIMLNVVAPKYKFVPFKIVIIGASYLCASVKKLFFFVTDVGAK